MKIRIIGTTEQHNQFTSLLKELEASNKLQIISTSKEYKNRNSVESRVYYEINLIEQKKKEKSKPAEKKITLWKKHDENGKKYITLRQVQKELNEFSYSQDIFDTFLLKSVNDEYFEDQYEDYTDFYNEDNDSDYELARKDDLVFIYIDRDGFDIQELFAVVTNKNKIEVLDSNHPLIREIIDDDKETLEYLKEREDLEKDWLDPIKAMIDDVNNYDHLLVSEEECSIPIISIKEKDVKQYLIEHPDVIYFKKGD